MNASITAGSSNVVGTQCERNYGIDVLKIVAMCMIVGAHILQHGLRYEQVETYTLKWFAVDFLIAMFTYHVDVYALISGYVKAGQKNRLKKACALWLVVFFYSFVSYLIQIIIGKDSFSLIGVAKCLALFMRLSHPSWNLKKRESASSDLKTLIMRIPV